MTTIVYPQKDKYDEPPHPKHRYRLYVIGSHCKVPTLYKKGSNELVLMVYDSRLNTWILGSIVGQCRFPKNGSQSIAIFNEGYMIGGQEKPNESIRIDIGRPKKNILLLKLMLKNQNITMKILKNKIKLIKLMVFKMKNKKKILIKKKVAP